MNPMTPHMHETQSIMETIRPADPFYSAAERFERAALGLPPDELGYGGWVWRSACDPNVSFDGATGALRGKAILFAGHLPLAHLGDWSRRPGPAPHHS
jgi:hypothetical protein